MMLSISALEGRRDFFITNSDVKYDVAVQAFVESLDD